MTGVDASPASSSAARMTATRPSIMSDGAAMSAPGRAGGAGVGGRGGRAALRQLPGLGGGAVERELVLAGHRLDFAPNVLAVGDEQRVDELLRREAGLPPQGAHRPPRGAAP